MILKIITSTTRPGNKGIAIANWMTELAKKNGSFEVELLELAKINLPLMDEPEHPRLQKYQHTHTRSWSEKINEADAFVIILGEYNYGIPAPIKNAIDYLFLEWKYKPLGLVSYGGISGGLRSAQMLKQVVTTVGMMPIPEQVNLPFFSKMINEQGAFEPDESAERSAANMLSQLHKWAGALKTLRA